MIQLNLLPPKVREADLLRKTLVAAAVAYCLSGAWIAWRWSLNEVKVTLARREVQRVQAQLNSPELQVAVQAVKRFADDMAAVKAKESVVNSLREQQVPLLKLLDEAPDWSMGGQVWFTQLSIAAANGAHTVNLSGAVPTRSQFAQYYEFMSGLTELQGLALNGDPVDGQMAGNKVVLFNLGFSVGDQP